MDGSFEWDHSQKLVDEVVEYLEYLKYDVFKTVLYSIEDSEVIWKFESICKD